MARPDKGTRQKLIDKARELIWTSSYGSVSVDDICRAADVRKGSFYHYFPSKLDLAITAMEEYFRDRVEPDMKRVFASNIPFPQQLEMLADTLVARKKEDAQLYGRVCGCPIAALGSEMIGQDEQVILVKVEEMFGRVRAMMLSSIQGAMEEGIIPVCDTIEKTQEVHDFITGLMIMSRIHNSIEGLERDLKPGLLRIFQLDVPDRSLATTHKSL